jgi:hypothetical protein
MFTNSREGYCPNCDEVKEIRITVTWQPDLCMDCDTEIDNKE